MAQATRRSILKTVGCAAMTGPRRLFASSREASGIDLGTQLNAMPIDPKDFSTFLTTLEKIRSIGFEGFETGYRNVMGQFDSAVDARSKIAATGLTFFAIHIFLQHALYDTETLIAPRALYEQVAKGGKALGARNVVVSGAAAQSVGQLKAKVAGLNAAGHYCNEQGIGFAYHNEEPESGSKLNELNVLYGETDPQTVRFLFDVGHTFNVGGDVVGFIRKYHQRIVGLHLRDYKNHQQVVLGTGDLPLTEIAHSLEQLQWTGWVETEEERLDGVKHGEAYLRPAFAAMKQAFRG